MFKKYRKKPVVAYALQWSGDYKKLAGDFYYMLFCKGKVNLNGNKLEICTLEGTMTASIGDWIIIGVEGEVYPCRDAIFKKTYEEVKESELEQ